jgi:hypothetical protein
MEGEFGNHNGGNLVARNRKYSWIGAELEQEKDDCVSQLVELDVAVTDGANDRADDSSLRGMALSLVTFSTDSK